MSISGNGTPTDGGRIGVAILLMVKLKTVRFGGWMDLKLKEDMQLPAAMEAMREFLL